MQHVSPGALARYLVRKSSPSEKQEIEWHLDHCPICKEELTAREVVDIAKEARKPALAVVRSAGQK